MPYLHELAFYRFSLAFRASDAANNAQLFTLRISHAAQTLRRWRFQGRRTYRAVKNLPHFMILAAVSISRRRMRGVYGVSL